jgi:serine protease Do
MSAKFFSVGLLLSAGFLAVFPTREVRPQANPFWLQGNPDDGDPELEHLNRAFIRLADKVRKAVVHVSVIPTDTRGSGFIINPQGYILTAQPVVAGGKQFEIRLANRERLRGELVATDAHIDCAIIKIHREQAFPFLPLSDSDGLKVGELVGSIGYPFGTDSSLHVGIVSRRGKQQRKSAVFDHIQVDSGANSGESGGPLVDMKGHVVGMITEGSVKGTLGFAVPINVIKSLFPRLVSGEKIFWGWLGVKLSTLRLDLADRLGLSTPRGVLVSSVYADQPADKAGVHFRDVILTINETAVDRPSDAIRIIKGTEADNEIRLTIFRAGETFVLPVKLGHKPELLDGYEG